MVNTSPPGGVKQRSIWFRIPGEIRNRIYRCLHCEDDIIECEDHHRYELSAQFLRTCKMVHNEAESILYGENTFKISITNTLGPRHSPFHSPTALWPIFSPELGDTMAEQRRQARRKQLFALVRKFHVEIRYTDEHDIKPIRDEVKPLAGSVLSNVNANARDGRIGFLSLDCKLQCDHENHWINWRDPYWDDYFPEGDEEECATMIRARFSAPALLGKVKEVGKITGLVEEDAECLRQHWQWKRSTSTAQDGQNEGEGKSSPSSTAPPPAAPTLLDLADRLEQRVDGMKSCEPDLKKAHIAAERGDVVLFQKYKGRIIEDVKRMWEELEGDDLLHRNLQK